MILEKTERTFSKSNVTYQKVLLIPKDIICPTIYQNMGRGDGRREGFTHLQRLLPHK